MSYDLKLFRKEVRKQYPDLSFLENEESVLSFTTAQIERLKKRLNHYKYQIENESDGITTYNFNGGELGITAYLTKNCLTFQCAGGGQEGLFEIMQTSDEFSDSEFLTLNLQEGNWSGMCLEDELESEKLELEKANSAIQNNLESSIITESKNTNTMKKPWWRFW
ncbi:MAG: hypothetical protein ABJI22_13560 [Maribacter sp.]